MDAILLSDRIRTRYNMYVFSSIFPHKGYKSKWWGESKVPTHVILVLYHWVCPIGFNPVEILKPAMWTFDVKCVVGW